MHLHTTELTRETEGQETHLVHNRSSTLGTQQTHTWYTRLDPIWVLKKTSTLGIQEQIHAAYTRDILRVLSIRPIQGTQEKSTPENM